MPPIKHKYKRFVVFSSITVIVYGLFVLVYGWGLKSGIFNPKITGHLPIALDAAACFILTGISMWCSVLYRSKPTLLLSRVLAICVFIWCTLFLAYGLISIDVPSIFGMSPHTGFCFICMSTGLFFLSDKNKKYFVQGLLHLVSAISFIVIMGHFLRVPELYHFSFIPMAIYTAIGFLFISVSASFVNYSIGITGLFTGKKMGNVMARRMFFNLLFATIVVCGFHVLSHRRHWISHELESALLMILFMLISLGLIWKTSITLNRIDLKRIMAIENFRIAVESAPYALVISDKKGKILSINEQTEVLYGYSRQNLVGKQVTKVIPPKMHIDYELRKEQFFLDGQVVKMGGDDDNEMLALRKDGSEFPIEIILVPIKTPMGMMSLASIVDITQRKNQEATIKKQLIELQVKNEELEQFNYISSHDLQEPLRTLSNYITLLEEEYPEQVNNEMKSHFHTMDAAVNRMTRVVQSLLEFGKLGRKKKLVATDCNLLLKDVVTDLSSLIKKGGAKVNVACGLPVFYAYETELRQLLQNLVANAIKFQKSNATPEIHVGCEERDGYYEFHVSDNGIGINPKYSEKIFRIFHRLNSDDAYDGHGIGLAHCKKIAEMHGGQIWVESEPGEGSTFKFTILKFSI